MADGLRTRLQIRFGLRSLFLFTTLASVALWLNVRPAKITWSRGKGTTVGAARGWPFEYLNYFEYFPSHAPGVFGGGWPAGYELPTVTNTPKLIANIVSLTVLCLAIVLFINFGSRLARRAILSFDVRSKGEFRVSVVPAGVALVIGTVGHAFGVSLFLRSGHDWLDSTLTPPIRLQLSSWFLFPFSMAILSIVSSCVLIVAMKRWMSGASRVATILTLAGVLALAAVPFLVFLKVGYSYYSLSLYIWPFEPY